MPIITVITGWLVRASVSERVAPLLAWAIAAIAAVALVLGGWALLKSSIINAHDDKVAGQQAQAQLEREHQADASALNLQQRDQLVQDELQEAIDNAVQSHPAEARASAGPATSAALDQLRRQAGSAGGR